MYHFSNWFTNNPTSDHLCDVTMAPLRYLELWWTIWTQRPAPPNRPWSYCNSPHLASAWPIPSLKIPDTIPCHGQNHLEFLEITGIQRSAWWLNVVDLALKNDGLRQWGWDDIPYMTWKRIQTFFQPPTRDSFIIWRFPKTISILLVSSKSWMTISLLNPVTWGIPKPLRNPRKVDRENDF